jgi:hypothetical protein
MPTEQIILNITNTQPYRTVVSLLGGQGDYYNQNVNANTLFSWDLSTINFATNPTFGLEYRPAGSVAPYSLYKGVMYFSFAGLISNLNSQSFFGFFWYDGLNVYTANDQIQFRQFQFNFT